MKNDPKKNLKRALQEAEEISDEELYAASEIYDKEQEKQDTLRDLQGRSSRKFNWRES